MSTKLGVGIAVLVIGSGMGFWGWHHARKTHTHAPLIAVETSNDHDSSPKSSPDAPVAIRTEPPAVGHAEGSPVAPSTDSPSLSTLPLPAMTADDTSVRSFHAKPDPVAPAEVRPAVSSTEPPPKTHDDAVEPAPDAQGTPPPLPAMPDVATLSESHKEPVSPLKSSLATSQPSAAGNKTTQHVMAAGETYSSLAEKYLGSSKYANLIAKANPGKDPRKLFVGSKINIPPAPKDAPAKTAPDDGATTSSKSVRVPAQSDVPPVPPEHAYKVQPGETWNDLARRFLGDAKRWTELYELNKERAPHPDGLKAGTVIELPAGVKPTTKPS